jgi:Flp pilus assembly protein TadG
MVSALADRARLARVPALLRRWRRDEAGVTAVEFALVAMPFMLLLFGIMSVSLYYFANFSLENALWQAARGIRTGQMQTSQGGYSGATTTADRMAMFKKAVCAKAPTFSNCTSKAVVIVQSNANFNGISAPSCANDGTMISQSSATFDAGASSSVVLATVCYPWDFGGKLPFFKLDTLKNGALLLQASVAFRTEPYN